MSLSGVMDKAVDFDILVSEFELQSYYNVYFRKKYRWERYKLPCSPLHSGLNSTTTVPL